jgi:hypothetical protein
MSLKRLASLLRTTQEAVRHRAKELGVSLVIGDARGGNIDTRTLRSTDGFVDPLLQTTEERTQKIKQR